MTTFNLVALFTSLEFKRGFVFGKGGMSNSPFGKFLRGESMTVRAKKVKWTFQIFVVLKGFAIKNICASHMFKWHMSFL